MFFPFFYIFTATIQRPEGEHFKEMVRVLREVSSEDRDIESLLTDRNLRTYGLIERGESIEFEGALRTVSKKRVKHKKPKVTIAEEADSERTHTDDEPLLEPTDVVQDVEEQRKGKAFVVTLTKKGRWKSVVTARSSPGVRISEMSPPSTESLYEGFADIPIPDDMSLQHDAGLEELSETLVLSESFPTGVADTSGWSRGCTFIHISQHCITFDYKPPVPKSD